ncbi:MAG: hypothetical protein AB1473_04270 [Thermodesulfobacteriota bacterium]
MKLVFVETRQQALGCKKAFAADPRVKLIGLTAEAYEALAECGLPCDPVHAYANTRSLPTLDYQLNVECLRLLQEIEAYVAERYPPARFDGPGFLSGNAYYIQYSGQFVLTRGFLVREVLRACSPRSIALLQRAIEPWFAGDGYQVDPGLLIAQEVAKAHGVHCEILSVGGEFAPDPAVPAASKAVKGLKIVRRLPGRAWRYSKRELLPYATRVLSACRLRPDSIHNLRGLRLLFADFLGYDWGPVLSVLRGMTEVDCFLLRFSSLDQRVWTRYYETKLYDVIHGKTLDLDSERLQINDAEARALGELYDEWITTRMRPPELTIGGLNLFPFLQQHLRAVTCLTPAVARHVDAVAERALSVSRPHAVCFFAIPWLLEKRLAHQARLRGIPVVCYQHGASYGTHRVPSHGQIEFREADYFLSYGEGVKPDLGSDFPMRARCIPVGSSRLEEWRAKTTPIRARKRQYLNLLWVGEVSFRNTISPWVVEDTERYCLEERCLQILGSAPGHRIVFRPYPHQVEWDGTCRWLKRTALQIELDVETPLETLILKSDVVVTDSSSGNVWNEALTIGRPLIVYCDPKQTPLMPHFIADLERACCWCRGNDELVKAVSRLVNDSDRFLTELRRIDTSDFLRKYVLHQDDGRCVQRVLSFLGSLREQQ